MMYRIYRDHHNPISLSFRFRSLSVSEAAYPTAFHFFFEIYN